jgi:tRNA threonylcarbamoyladenosine biosynthesis protein TsaE
MTNAFYSTQLSDEAATLALGERLGSLTKAGDFIALYGPLGTGKTTLARGLIRAFVGQEIDVPSPTFTLVQTYTREAVAGPSLDLFHFDLYRLKNGEEVWELGWEDLTSAVAVVEWPQNAQDHLPANRLEIHISPWNGGRQADFFTQAPDVWKDRLYGA